MTLPPPPTSHPSTTPALSVPLTAAIEVRDLRYDYPDGTPALRGVSMAVGVGECVGLIGPNGAGKSTLLLHFNGVLPDPLKEEGCVVVGGTILGRKNVHEIRRRVGLMFQDADDQLFCPTVFEDVAFGPQQFGVGKEELAQRVREALAQAGLGEVKDIGKRAPHRLSGGEKRRVCLAGVLACQPEILVLDEPTSGLDPRGRRELQTLLRQITATKIIATHDLELVAQLCTRTFILDHGQIVAQGETQALLSDEALMLAHGLERPHWLLHQHPHL